LSDRREVNALVKEVTCETHDPQASRHCPVNLLEWEEGGDFLCLT